jgi:hypothetical protein
MIDIKPITEKEWVGLSLKDGIEKAERMGYTHRIVEENGKAKMLEYNNKSNRVNFRLSNNVIIGVYPG